MKAKRNWKPCRRCGTSHQNPSSSSICEACGPIEAAENKQRMDTEQMGSDIEPERTVYMRADIEAAYRTGYCDAQTNTDNITGVHERARNYVGKLTDENQEWLDNHSPSAYATMAKSDVEDKILELQQENDKLTAHLERVKQAVTTEPKGGLEYWHNLTSVLLQSPSTSLAEVKMQYREEALSDFDSILSTLALRNGWDTESDAYQVQQHLREFIDQQQEPHNDHK